MLLFKVWPGECRQHHLTRQITKSYFLEESQAPVTSKDSGGTGDRGSWATWCFRSWRCSTSWWVAMVLLPGTPWLCWLSWWSKWWWTMGESRLPAFLVLQEDPPASIFTNRQVVATSRSRSFAPLADQRWITVALAYLREMDLIANKRLEFAGGGKASLGGSEEVPTPKPKGAPKKKGRGKGANQSVEEETG